VRAKGKLRALLGGSLPGNDADAPKSEPMAAVTKRCA